MDLLNKLTIKDLKLNKKRTVVTIIGIMLSVALITAVASVYLSGLNSIIKYEKKVKGNYHVAYLNVKKEELSVFENNRSIDKNYTIKNIGYAKIPSKNDGKPYAYIRMYSKDSLNNLSVNLLKGRLPKNNKEIIIPSHLETNGRLTYKLGDEIDLDVGTRIYETGEILNQNYGYDRISNPEKIINTKKTKYKIVGLMERPPVEIEPYHAPGYTFITYLSEKEKLDTVDIYSLYKKQSLENIYKTTANIIGVDEKLFVKYNTTLIDKKEDLDKFTDLMKKAKYEMVINTYLISLETQPLKSNGFGEIWIVAVIVTIIIILTSVFCIKNSFDISITEKIRQYGMLRSVGATKKQIRRNVFYEATILAIIGIPLGIILGNIATYILIFISNLLLENVLAENFILVYSFSPISVVIAIVLGLITIYLSSLKSAIISSRVSPIESIRNSAEIKINAKKLKTPNLVSKLFGIGGEISYKNIKRNKKKYRTTTISLAISVLTFIALSTFIGLGFASVKKQLNPSSANLELFVNQTDKKLTSERYKKLENTKNLENIEDYTILRYNELNLKNPKYNKEYMTWLKWIQEEQEREKETHIFIVSLGKEQYKKYIKSLNLKYEDTKDKAIFLDYAKVQEANKNIKNARKKMMRVFSYKENEKIKNLYDNEDKNINLQIVKVVQKAPFGLENNFSNSLIVSDEYFDKNIKVSNMKILYKSKQAAKLQKDIYINVEDVDFDINNKEENIKRMTNLLILVAIFLYGFIIVISLIGITNIYNTITTNIELRKREFAMLKSIGMTKDEFNKMIRLESVFIGFKSLLFGIPIGTLISYIIYYFMGKNEALPYNLPIIAIILSIVVIFGLIFLIMRYSVSKINKQNIIETIRNENI